MVFCDYIECKNKQSFGISRFLLPKDHRRDKWLVNSGNSFSKKLISNEKIYICAEHFDRKFLNLSPFSPRLSKSAVPISYQKNRDVSFNSESVFNRTQVNDKDINKGQEVKNTRCKKQPIDEHNSVATTSSTASDGENLLKYATIKEDKTSTKASGLESHGSDTELTADESFTVLEIIEESEEENKELDFEYENDTPTAKRRKLKGQETPLEDALQCMKTYMNKNKKRDEHSIFGELIAHKIRTCNRSNRDIAIAHHHIENVIFNLTMGVYTKIRPPAPASKRKSELTTPAANTDIVPSTRDLEYNLIIPKTEPE